VNRRVLAIAHRGASGITPENTRLAFVKALDLAADMIEFDVQLTRDETPIVFHDETLERTTNGSGRVSETDFETIARLDAGSWFAASFTDVEVPTLEEVLSLMGGKIAFNIELKPDRRIDALVRRVVTAVARFDLFHAVIFSSFDVAAMHALRVLVPDARIGVLCEKNGLEGALAQAEELGAEALHPAVSMVDTTVVAEAHARKLAVYPWTANEPGEIALLRALGVDGIFTDFPDRVARPRR
jgi:glycerophosphoryl diester phosphodiesterase